jgi:uncharacterized protein (UPF0333 family)
VFRKGITKKRFAVLGAVAILAMAGIAVAYFTSSGSGTGSASVGKSTAFTVEVSSDTSGSLYPGSGSETLSYTVTNPGTGAQNLSATTATVASAGGNITEGGNEVEGCKASWFTAKDSSPAPKNLKGGESTTGSVEVTMQDSGNQDACQGANPDITVNAS